jgi:hypothetical protein
MIAIRLEAPGITGTKVIITYISLPCPALPLEFKRRYNSLLADTNSLGVGWTHSFDWKVVVTNTDQCALASNRSSS